MAAAQGQVLSSLPLQVLMYFHGWFDWIFVILSLVLYVYKGQVLPYPEDFLAMEVVGILLIAAIDPCRLLLGSRGNKTETLAPIIWFICLSVPLILGHVYYVRYQVFVLRADQVLNGFSLAFLALEFFLALWAALVFWQQKRHN